MVLAHVRGLLKPDYPNGVRSRIRERMLLNSLERETQGSGFLARANVEAASLAAADPGACPKIYTRALGYVLQGISLLQLMPYSQTLNITKRIANLDDIKKQAILFKVLKKTNFYEKMASVLERYTRR